MDHIVGHFDQSIAYTLTFGVVILNLLLLEGQLQEHPPGKGFDGRFTIDRNLARQRILRNKARDADRHLGQINKFGGEAQYIPLRSRRQPPINHHGYPFVSRLGWANWDIDG